MKSPKRNRPSASRIQAIREQRNLYTVQCLGTHCDCASFGQGCRRGFFSLWIQAVYGCFFASRWDIPVYIDFGDKKYLYSDPEKFHGDLNFWNYYYEQNDPGPSQVPLYNLPIETYPLRIWDRRHFKDIHQNAVKDLKLKPQVMQHIRPLMDQCRQRNALGVHIRRTDHPVEVDPVSLHTYMKALRSSKSEAFFVATDDQRILELMLKEFGTDRVIYQESAIRSQDDEAVHTDHGHQDRYRLGLEVLTDCYALSACDHCLLVHSNVSYAALLINPTLTYTLLERASSKFARRRTRLLYLLDRWGIRKM